MTERQLLCIMAAIIGSNPELAIDARDAVYIARKIYEEVDHGYNDGAPVDVADHLSSRNSEMDA